ncbi:MAG: M20/M25/M40 family metallo-hydrolase, partial [Bacteroidia bacterium]|nr:M20/M25/M40 family metallo-hydrolase [Bacteroidia bacterium]
VAGKDFFVFPFSPNQNIEALPAIAVREANMPWFFDLKETLEENTNNPHFDILDYIQTNSKNAKNKGASAVLFYNTSSLDDKLEFDAKDKTEQLNIPVVYVFKEAAQKYFNDASATLTINLTTEISEKHRTGHNVIGYIDNGAATTVILGAHFDHLGYGEDGSSLLRTGEHLVHNGADDNASGTAALIELARKLKSSHAKNNNYLFIAFSGEELGLFGSKYFTEHPVVDLNSVDYMINMDMIGRLNDSSKVITIGGFGTSPTWGDVFSVSSLQKNRSPFVFKYDSSGTGPSDHTSFYRKDIPVLFYFTGIHSDYHKPTDDADKINYKGEQMIIQHIYYLIEQLNDKPKLVFAKTRETQTSHARFSVSLGIMPDYTFPGTGVRADGISDDRPAQKAGMKTGDVIIQLGENNITSLENYMQALSKFKKGDKTQVKFKRGNEILEATIEF